MNPQANIFKLVHDWLCDKKNGRWLLVRDNVDDAGFLFESQSFIPTSQGTGEGGRQSQPLMTYLPRSSQGAILMTTRTKAVARRLVEENDVSDVLRSRLGAYGIVPRLAHCF